jgi:hypothetical protein
MITKRLILFIASFVLLTFVKAQNKQADSTAVAATFKTLLDLSKNVDFADPKTTSMGALYKAADYVVYRGDDKARAWKAFANYKNAEEKKAVDEVCTKINQTVNQDANYRITKYAIEKESEGTWYILYVSYKKDGANKNALFAFLKIGNRFGLGDID